MNNSNQIFELYSSNTLGDELVEISVLMEVLGYKDMRTVRKWCSKNKVQLRKLGKRTYMLKLQLPRITINIKGSEGEPEMIQRQKSKKGRGCQEYARHLINKYGHVENTG